MGIIFQHLSAFDLNARANHESRMGIKVSVCKHVSTCQQMSVCVPWLPFYFRKSRPEHTEHLKGWVRGSSSLDRVIGSVTVPLTFCARSQISNRSKRLPWHIRNDLAAAEACTISALVLHLWCICGLDLLQASASGCK